MDYCNHFLSAFAPVFYFRVTDSLLKISLPCSAQYLKIHLHCLLHGAAHKPSKICFCEATHLVSFLCCQRMKATLTCLNHGAPPNLSASPLLTCNRVCASATCIPDFRAAACYSLSAHPRPPYPAPRMICSCRVFITASTSYLQLPVILK